MHNIFLIARREYLERVRSRSFVIMTILIPALMFGVSVVPTMLANRASTEAKHLVIVAADRETAEALRSQIEQGQDKKADDEQAKGPRKRGLPRRPASPSIWTPTPPPPNAPRSPRRSSKNNWTAYSGPRPKPSRQRKSASSRATSPASSRTSDSSAASATRCATSCSKPKD